MSFDPATSDLDDLFRDPDMFDSPNDWKDAGFRIIRSSENKICVASHKSVDGYLFKKYVASGKRDDFDDQLDNYETRLEGSRRMRDLIDSEGLQHVACPQKWLRELPEQFGSKRKASHILIVERFDLLDGEDSERQYGKIREDVLADLCVALHAFRGLDSTAKNVPFTTDGKVAFIDTEHWNRHAKRKKSKQRPWMKYLSQHMSSDRRSFAKQMWNRLEGDDSDDFLDEESTSSSSSGSSS